MSNTYNPISSLMHVAALLAVALAAVGCSQQDDNPDVAPEPTGHAITFTTVDSTVAVTRAPRTERLSALGFNEIKVYGYKTVDGNIQNVMPGYTMKYVENSANSSTTNTTGWEYVGQGTDYLGYAQEIKYWDGNSSNYRFFGVLPTCYKNLKYANAEIGNKTVVNTTENFSMEFKDLEFMTRDSVGTYYKSDGTTIKETDIPMYCTLWQGNPAQNNNKPVELAFVKPYSLVRLVFERPDGSSQTQLGKTGDTEHQITFAPQDGSTMTGDGKVDVSWSMTENRETATATAGTKTLPTMTLGPVTLVNENTRYQAWPEYLMIPTTSSGAVDFKCSVYIYTKNTNGEDVSTQRIAIVPAAYTNWKPGYQYTYVFKISSTNQLEFSHAVEVYTKWQAGYSDKTEW